MGLTSSSTGKNAIDTKMSELKNSKEKIIALAGNPNVGKSTVFNGLTGMHQHTGNWAGKTVANAVGRCKSAGKSYLLVDIPGTYSLFTHSAEEQVARDFICFGGADLTLTVCDATCLERNLGLVLQIAEATGRCAVCVNLLDEARRKGISIDLDKLSKMLGMTVVGTVGRKKSSVKAILDAIEKPNDAKPFEVRYPDELEAAVDILKSAVKPKLCGKLSERWVSLRLLDGGEELISKINGFVGTELLADKDIREAFERAQAALPENYKDMIAGTLITESERIARSVVCRTTDAYNSFDMRVDRFVTSRFFGYPLMLLVLALSLWITIIGANYPSRLLLELSARLEDAVSSLLISVNAPETVRSLLAEGVLRVLCWVVSVMLPPMAIFFPLFTLLEDVGYLPRIAYNLDKPFRCANACGKQALTMCMGFGCNAAGVTGCRIIDSPRERLVAVITNSLVPCNGRFPTLINIITMFCVAGMGFGGSFAAACILCLAIAFGVVATFAVSKLLTMTFLKGESSSFTLEMPPYRKPQLCKTLVRSLFDRTLFVLGRAAAVAAPAGLIIWLMANVTVDGKTVLALAASILEPVGRAMGLDGVILLAFILGFPANEIVLPIIIMTYLASGTITDLQDLGAVKEILVANGWTIKTAVCTVLFSIFHFPCSTTVITIYKETKSIKWTLLSVILPTALGMILCIAVNLIF